MRELPCLELNRHADRRVRAGHPWIYSNEIADSKRLTRVEQGSEVDVLDCHGNYVGTGFVHHHSLIAIRIFSRIRGEVLDAELISKRLKKAVLQREAIYGKGSLADSTYRAVFGESDELPGLVVDRYRGAWVIEPHSFGMAMRAGLIAECIALVAKDVLGEKDSCIYFRTDNRSASLEGMEVKSELILGTAPKNIFAVEDGISFPVDPLKGQKTGFFFDQRDNRTFFRDWVAGKTHHGKNEIEVLDLYCHAGAWGLRALKAGAKKAVFVDSSASALASVKEAALKMGLADRIELIENDCLATMKSFGDRKFSAISLDPPALIPNKKAISQGSKMYRDINAAAISILKEDGILSTSSCSFHLAEDRFDLVVAQAMVESGKLPRVIRRGGLSVDHPSILTMPEGRYLKNLVVQY